MCKKMRQKKHSTCLKWTKIKIEYVSNHTLLVRYLAINKESFLSPLVEEESYNIR